MFTDQDRVYVQQAKVTADKSAMIDKVCRFIYAMLAMWSCWLFYSDAGSSNVFNSPPIMFVFVAFTFIQTVRRLLGDVDTSHYKELVSFLEAKLAEVDEKEKS